MATDGKEHGILGLDPGKMGGIGLYTNGNYDGWILTEKKLDICRLIYKLQKQYDIKACYFEKVHASPQMGVSSAFTFGREAGLLYGIVLRSGIKIIDVTPQQWQTELGCLTRGNKNVSKTRAQGLFPNKKITHQIADAMLIAKYGWDRYHGVPLSFGKAGQKPNSPSSFSRKSLSLESFDL